MRLLHATTFKFHAFYGKTPDYAILSHTWGNDRDEVSYRDIIDSKAHRRMAWSQKVVPCAKQAIKDGYSYIWIDTCCIDKSSAVELSEAINSMYRWYQQSQVCYVVMLDVPEGKCIGLTGHDSMSFAESRWFSRGWTLQELLAPRTVKFFSAGWKAMGSRNDSALILWMITGIELKYLTGNASVKEASVAERMFWASRREIKRPEDRAYSLLGIFDVSMPPVYGEGGEQAFQRLQEQIIKKLPDDSILAWGYDPLFDPDSAVMDGIPTSLLAQSPSDFMFCSGFTLREDNDEFTVNPTPTCIINVTTSVFQMEARLTSTRHEMGNIWLNCRFGSGGDMVIGTIPIAWKTLDASPVCYRPRNWSISYSEPRDDMEEMQKMTLSVSSHSALIQPVTQRGVFMFKWNPSDMEVISKCPESAWNETLDAFVFDSGPIIMAVHFLPLKNHEKRYVAIIVSPTREFNESTRWLVMEEKYATPLSTILNCWPEFRRQSQEDSFPFGLRLEREISVQTSYIKPEARYIFEIMPRAPECPSRLTFPSADGELTYLLMERRAIELQLEIESLQRQKQWILDERDELGITMMSAELEFT